MGFPNRYAALPRTSTDSNLSNVTEENENVRLDVYAPQLGSSFSFRAFPLPFWFLASVSIVCSFLTVSGYRKVTNPLSSMIFYLTRRRKGWGCYPESSLVAEIQRLVPIFNLTHDYQ